MMDLFEAAVATAGAALGGNPTFAGVSTDSRSIAASELFVALKGDRFDGHEFVSAAAARGACAAMVGESWWEKRRRDADAPPLPLLVVADTRRALGALAAQWRARFDPALIAVTGSNGKTTVKEMCAAILRAWLHAQGLDAALAVLASTGNLNNEIGLPLTLLRLRRSHRAAVVELGMSHPGEIATLARIARPGVAVVTNAQRAHLAGLASLSEVAREKGELYRALPPEGTAVINADDTFAGYWSGVAGARRVLSFGIEKKASVSARWTPKGLSSVVELSTPLGGAQLTLRVPGAHNVRDALAAAAAGIAAGAPLAALVAGLEGFGGVPGRLRPRAARGGAMLIDDTYNANPDSVRAAIDVLSATTGRKILVLGDMGEIGEASGQYHDEVGGYAKSQGVDRLFALGEHAELAARNFGAGGGHFRKFEDLVAALLPELASGTTVLVKGSRFMRMERVADAIAAQEGE
ncbi:MAG: UDP-N-acetylmuramoyl-tripeptide--D-alanyl-D-alanine ligase [Rhodocyclaceae bacterium]